MKILLLEDSPTDSLLFAVSLRELTKVQLVKQVSYLEEVKPNLAGIDCAILDLRLPACDESDVWNLAKKIKDQVVVLIHSGKSDQTLAFDCAKEGFLFVPKGNTTQFGMTCAIEYARGVCEREANSGQ